MYAVRSDSKKTTALFKKSQRTYLNGFKMRRGFFRQKKLDSFSILKRKTMLNFRFIVDRVFIFKK